MSSTHDDMKRFLVPQCKWDSKASPFGFWLFLGAIGAVVRTSTHWSGHLLEEFLDAKLKRAGVKKSSVPSYSASPHVRKWAFDLRAKGLFLKAINSILSEASKGLKGQLSY